MTRKPIPAHLIEEYAIARRAVGDTDAWDLYQCASFGRGGSRALIRGRTGWTRETARARIEREMRVSGAYRD